MFDRLMLTLSWASELACWKLMDIKGDGFFKSHYVVPRDFRTKLEPRQVLLSHQTELRFVLDLLMFLTFLAEVTL